MHNAGGPTLLTRYWQRSGPDMTGPGNGRAVPTAALCASYPLARCSDALIPVVAASAATLITVAVLSELACRHH